MSEKRDAADRLETIVSLAQQIIDKAKAAQAAVGQVVANEPPERTSE